MSLVFISGSSDGLGLLAARLLVDWGHEVTLHARSAARAEDARRSVPEAKAVAIGDLSSIEETQRVAEQVNSLGRHDAVIHNAGVGYREARRIETVAAPLFPRYLFVAIDLNMQRWRSICSTVGISRLVCNGDDPTPVPMGIVEALRSREDAGGFIKLDCRPRFRAGDKVRVLDGAFSSCFGLFEGTAERERIAILLDLLGRKVRVVLGADLVAAA